MKREKKELIKKRSTANEIFYMMSLDIEVYVLAWNKVFLNNNEKEISLISHFATILNY